MYMHNVLRKSILWELDQKQRAQISIFSLICYYSSSPGYTDYGAASSSTSSRTRIETTNSSKQQTTILSPPTHQCSQKSVNNYIESKYSMSNSSIFYDILEQVQPDLTLSWHIYVLFLLFKILLTSIPLTVTGKHLSITLTFQLCKFCWSFCPASINSKCVQKTNDKVN